MFAQELKEKQELPAGFEARLMERAEDLLAARRERAAGRVSTQRRRSQARARAWSSMGEAVARIVRVHPVAAQMAAVLLIALVFALVRDTAGGRTALSFDDLPQFSKSNDVPRRLDAQWEAERRAYDREVEESKRRTDGGI